MAQTSYAFNPLTGRLDRTGTGGGGGGSGDVNGPSSSGDNDIAVFDGITGKLIKDSAISSINPTFSGAVSTLQTFNLPETVASNVGVINMDGKRYLHSYGDLSNTFGGSESGNFTSTTIGNTGFGNLTLQSLTSGESNAIFGHASGGNITSGSFNSTLGEGTLFLASGSITGTVAIGWHTLILASGNYTIGIGYDVMSSGVSGEDNLGIGRSSLKNLTNGAGNLAFGALSGIAYTGSESGNLLLDNSGVAGDQNVSRIGSNDTVATYLYGIPEQISVDENLVLFDVATDKLGTVPGKPQVSLKSGLVSLVGAGSRQLFITQKDFIPLQVVMRVVAVTSPSGGAQCSLGFNPPDYDNIVLGGIAIPLMAGNYSIINIVSSDVPIVPAGTSVRLNVVIPDSTATVYDVYVYVTGFYA